MKIKIPSRRLFSRVKVSRSKSFTKPFNVDVREEYANAFRTESYLDFWTRVLEFSNGESANRGPLRSTTAGRLPSYRLFVDHFLDPDQATTTRMLASAKSHPKYHALLSDYFSETADASILCGLLLKDTQQMQVEYRVLKATTESLEKAQTSPLKHLPVVITRLRKFSKSSNPASCSRHLQAVQLGCTRLLRRLEISRDKAQAKLNLIKRVKSSSAVLLVALTVSVTIVVVTHVLPLLVAVPALVAVSVDLASTRKLTHLSAQLDTAAKGMYIINRDLDTISRLVEPVNDEIEHMRTMSRFWLDRGDERLQASGEVARQLRKSGSSFGEQLDELEEHLYLCFMTINRSRKLVVKEIMVHGVTPYLL